LCVRRERRADEFGDVRRKEPRVEARKPYDIDTLTTVALCVFAERGYDAASMDDVARAAGISKASIYHHVSSKEALLERGLRRALDALFSVLDELDSANGSAAARLRHIVRRVAEITFALRPELSVLFRIRGNSVVEREALERRRAFDRIVGKLVASAQAEGDLRADLDAGVVTRLVFGMSNSVVEWYRSGGRVADAEIARAVVAMTFDGLYARD
jgi:AcrR family transcriptional regulator